MKCLEITVDEGVVVLVPQQPMILRKLRTLSDVCLGYVKIGQPATTLSGGEAQRVKLATELMKRPTGVTISILHEPTTGLLTAHVPRVGECAGAAGGLRAHLWW
jgi:Excinuclease ATPase subunit